MVGAAREERMALACQKLLQLQRAASTVGARKNGDTKGIAVIAQYD